MIYNLPKGETTESLVDNLERLMQNGHWQYTEFQQVSGLIGVPMSGLKWSLVVGPLDTSDINKSVLDFLDRYRYGGKSMGNKVRLQIFWIWISINI